MAGPVRRVLREPLVQFLAIGAVIVALASARGTQDPAPAAERVLVDAALVAQLEDLVAQNWRRAPTREDMDRVIAAYVREEILAREALKLGLDDDDSIIRQRLAQKMEFLLEPPPGALDVTDDALAAYLADNIARYMPEPQVAITQVFLAPEVHGDALEDDAAAIRAALENGAHPAALSDETLLPQAVTETALGNVRRIFGPEVAATVMALPEGTWSEPVTSAYGAHLVRVDSRVVPPAPTLEDVRATVERDYRLKAQEDYIDARYHALRETYEVVIERPVPTDGAAPSEGSGG